MYYRGTDFRPVYRDMASIQSIFEVPNLALTATATQNIHSDIIKVLSFNLEKTEIVASLPNRYQNNT